MTYARIDSLTVGTPIMYDCAAQMNRRATVTQITIGRNAADELIPWITVSFQVQGTQSFTTTRLPATESALRMFNVRVI